LFLYIHNRKLKVTTIQVKHKIQYYWNKRSGPYCI